MANTCTKCGMPVPEPFKAHVDNLGGCPSGGVDVKKHFIAMSQDGARPEPEVVGDYANVKNFIKFALPKARPGAYKVYVVEAGRRVFVTDAWRRA